MLHHQAAISIQNKYSVFVELSPIQAPTEVNINKFENRNIVFIYTLHLNYNHFQNKTI